MSDLKACPFCGSENIHTVTKTEWPVTMVHHYCAGCFITQEPAPSEKMAVSEWNTRHLPPEVEKVIEAAREQEVEHWKKLRQVQQGETAPCDCDTCTAIRAFDSEGGK